MSNEHLNVTAFVACDKIIQEAGTNKKSIIGVFRNFDFPSIPNSYRPWFIFSQIENVDPGAHTITVNLVHDQTQAVAFGASLEIPENHQGVIDLAVQADAAVFSKEGHYVGMLNLDGRQIACFSMTVALVQSRIGGI